jgi:hypothetical protein
MALIWSVYWPTPDKMGPDLDKMGRVVEVDDEIARQRAGSPGLAGDGTARWPTEEELAAYHEERELAAEADEVLADGGDLTKMRKADLLQHAADLGVDVDESMTKADIAAAVEEHRAAQAEQGPAEAEGTGGPVVTVAPGTGEPAARVTDGAGNDVGGTEG